MVAAFFIQKSECWKPNRQFLFYLVALWFHLNPNRMGFYPAKTTLRPKVGRWKMAEDVERQFGRIVFLFGQKLGKPVISASQRAYFKQLSSKLLPGRATSTYTEVWSQACFAPGGHVKITSNFFLAKKSYFLDQHSEIRTYLRLSCASEKYLLRGLYWLSYWGRNIK